MPPTPVFALTGHTALITGSARGLGLEMARGLAAAGARVVLNGRDPARLGQAAQLLADEGLKTVTCPFDVTNADATTAALESLLEVSGPVDILVNNVGQRDRRGLDAVTTADLARMVDTHVISAYRISRYVAQDLIRRTLPGRIINVSSVLAHLGRLGDLAYPVAKSGLDGLTRSLAAELGPHDITVNAIAPGSFATETNAALAADPVWQERLRMRTALGRWGRPRGDRRRRRVPGQRLRLLHHRPGPRGRRWHDRHLLSRSPRLRLNRRVLASSIQSRMSAAAPRTWCSSARAPS